MRRRKRLDENLRLGISRSLKDGRLPQFRKSPTKSTTMASSTTTTANDGDSKRKVALLTGITGQDGSTQLSKSFNKLHYADLTDA
ncbi:hypothetical protein LguiB_007759 [Lonicera macranthoides]